MFSELMVEIIVADITTVGADIVVNAANKSLLGGGGVDGAIHHAAGSGLREECMRLRQTLPNGLKVGEIAVTSAHKLPARWIIHTVGPMQGFDDVELLASCYRNSLLKAEELNARSIVFPAISTGKHKVPLETSAKIVKTVLADFKPNTVERIILIFDKQEDKERYETFLMNSPQSKSN